jgi:hypothetical protein
MPRPPAGDRVRLLFTPGARLGWTFRDRHALIPPYREPPPDPDLIRQQTAAQAASAGRSYQFARKWVARPSLMLAVVLAVLAGCAKAINPAARAGDIVLTALVLCGPGLAWTGWQWRRRYQAGTVNPARVYELARQEYGQRASWHQQSELARLDGLPEWGSAEPPARRTDVFGGTLAGWRSLLAVHGASLLAQQPLLVADLSGQYAAADLAGLARAAGVPSAEYLLPRDLDRSGLLTRLAPGQLAAALAEAIHAGTPGSRADRAIDVRVLEHMCTALRAGGITPARLAAAAEVALGYPGSSLLTSDEAATIRGSLLGDGYRNQVSANLIRLDAFLSGLGRYAGTGQAAAAAPAWCTFWLSTPGAGSAHTELLDALIIQWLTVQVSASTAATPAVIIAAADHITRDHLERLAAACEHRGVHLTLLFRHLRDDATALIGGGNTAFMRLGNHHEAEQAASFIGRHHTFVLSGFTATLGGNQSRTGSSSYSYGTGESRGSSVTSNWADDHLFDPTASGSRTRSRDRSTSQNWSNSVSREHGTNWSDATSMQRTYEYQVEPSVLQHLPDHALLLASQGHSTDVHLQAVESSSAIINLPHVSTRPLSSLDLDMRAAELPPTMNQADRPQLAPRRHQPQWPPMSGESTDAQWQSRRQTPWPQPHQQPPEHHD